MDLKDIQIKNFRCFKDELINFDNYTCFVGANGSGKSTILMALNVFFRNTETQCDVRNLQKEDFFQRNISEPIEIICTFNNLDDEELEEFKDYVRQNELIVKAKAFWDEESQSAEVLQYGIRKVNTDFTSYFEAEKSGAKAKDLKEIYQKIRENYTDLPNANTKDAMRSSLRSYEENHPELCEPCESSDQFYGWRSGGNLLAKFIQWVYIPAVKDPTEEQDEQKNTALGNLLQRTISTEGSFQEELDDLKRKTTDEYRRILEDKQEILSDTSSKIEELLKQWAHPGVEVQLNWHFDEKKSISIANPFARAKVGENGFLGDIARSGHGLQRSFVVALLQVLSTIQEQEKSTLILGFEEPELYQHPPQARHLASLLEQLSTQNNQVILTTHNPYFVSSKGYEQIRLVKKQDDQTGTKVSQFSFEELSKKLSDALNDQPKHPSELIASITQIMQPTQNEMFFCYIPIFVEGPEDVAIISTYLQFHSYWSDFRKLGCHFIICEGKTNISRPLAIAYGFNLPCFVIFDGDSDETQLDSIEKNKRDNRCLLYLLDDDSPPMPEENLFKYNFVMWNTKIINEIQKDIGVDTWNKAEEISRSEYNLFAGVRQKNPILVSSILEYLLSNHYSLPLLESLSENIFTYARENTSCSI